MPYSFFINLYYLIPLVDFVVKYNKNNQEANLMVFKIKN